MSLQDAVETVLLVVAETVNATISKNTEFDKYFQAINAKVEPKVLILQSEMSRLNRLRVQAKHAGIFPRHTQATEMIPVVEAFLTDVCKDYLGWDWMNLGLSNLIENKTQSAFLRDAEQALTEQRFRDALVAARMAIFDAFEKAYDIRSFETDAPGNALFMMLSCSAPPWAKSIEYVQKNVGDPFQYIVIDHTHLDTRLVKMGADPVMFWNIWRITPAVYCFGDSDWVVKRELDKTEREDLEADAVYVVDSVAELLILLEQQTRKQRVAPSGIWTLKVKQGATLRTRAAEDAPVSWVFEAPSTLQASAETCGLDGKGTWWQGYWYGEDAFKKGFLANDDVDWSAD